MIIGPEVALFAKENLPSMLKSSAAFRQRNYQRALTECFLGLDSLLFAGRVGTVPEKVGTTACVALVAGTDILVANTGDSRCVLCKSGQTVDMSTDHKPRAEKERRRVAKAGGRVVEGRINNVLGFSRSLGDLAFKRKRGLGPEEQLVVATPDVKTEITEAGTEFLILACDGVWDCLKSEEAVCFVRICLGDKKCGKLSQAVVELFDRILPPTIDATSKGVQILCCEYRGRTGQRQYDLRTGPVQAPELKREKGKLLIKCECVLALRYRGRDDRSSYQYRQTASVKCGQ